MMPNVSLSKRELGLALTQLADHDDAPARLLYTRLVGSWDGFWGPGTVERRFCTARLLPAEYDTFQRLDLPGRILPIYTATYGDPDNPNLAEVRVHSITRPPKRRTFKIAGGKARLTRTTIQKLNPTEQENIMARKTKTLAPAVDDELDGLEELDELDETEDLDAEDEVPAPKKKESAAAKKRRLAKEAAAAEEDEEDEDDDDADEDDEDEAPAPKAKKGKAAKATAKPKAKGNRTPPPTRELPDGRVGPNELAEMVGDITGREVRMYLRKKGIAKNEELGRYAFTQAQAAKIAKAMKAARA